MPLVRIDMVRGRDREAIRAIADTVYEVMREVFAAPAGDRYQIVHQHDPGELLVEDTGLGIERTDGVVVLQVTHQGRDADQKQAFYRVLAERLDARGLVTPTDLVVTMTENTKEDWSFGHGRAQFLTGEL